MTDAPRTQDRAAGKRRGPKPRPAAELRSKRISVYVTAAEDAVLEARAGSKEKVPEYLRDAGLSQLPPRIPEVNQQAWAELARLAANLNQHQRAINEGRADRPPVDLAELAQAVGAVRLSLIGATLPEPEEDDEE